jgi:hypothetical protein
LEIKKLTNTLKLILTNESNTNEISHLAVKEFHTLHALSLYIFIYDTTEFLYGSYRNNERIREDFPDPVLPMIDVLVRAGRSSEISFKISSPSCRYFMQ